MLKYLFDPVSSRYLSRETTNSSRYVCFQCAKTFVNLMGRIAKDQTVQYILTMIDNMLQVLLLHQTVRQAKFDKCPIQTVIVNVMFLVFTYICPYLHAHPYLIQHYRF